MTLDYALLVRVLRDPAQLAGLWPVDVSGLIDAASETRLLGWLVHELDARGLPVDAPEWLSDRIGSARATSRECERALRWETDRISRALGATGVQWMLLKGAAYVAAGLPPGRGRRVADIDVLVPLGDLPAAERALNEHGWRPGALDPYDDRYYRDWMHELPPMMHEARRSIVDLHHAILPRTSRLHPPTTRIVERAVSVNGVKIPCASHLVLHAAAHLFHDGEVSGAIRDVVDIDGLLRAFGGNAGFWTDFVGEARALDLQRPAYYAVRYARRLLDTPVPASVDRELRAWAPPAAVAKTMDALVTRALVGPTRTSGAKTAALALYVRAHWLRMPTLMLARHLTHQMFRRDAST